MQWCAEHGIAHSQFLSWDDADRSKLIAYIIESRSQCSSCGTSDWEWDNDPDAYQAMRRICKGCMVLYAAEEDKPSLGSRMVLIPKKRANEIAANPKRIRRR